MHALFNYMITVVGVCSARAKCIESRLIDNCCATHTNLCNSTESQLLYVDIGARFHFDHDAKSND